MIFFQYSAVGVASVLIAWAAWQDFLSWKIPNRIILTLIAIYVLLAIGRSYWDYTHAGTIGAIRSEILGELAAGVLLFVLGFVLWMFRLFGAGDAKLFFPLGLFIGFQHLILFATALAVAGIVAAIFLKVRIPIEYHAYTLVARLEEIRSTGKVPYGVLMAVAGLIAIWSRYISG